MTALRILGTALTGIFVDFGQTLRIFALPGLLIMLTVAALLWFSLSRNSILLDLLFALAVITTLVSSLWSAVNFHRHILLGERFGWLPRLHGRAMLGYGLMMIPMGLVLAGVITLTSLLFSTIYFEALDGLRETYPHASGIALALVLSTLYWALTLRLFSMLPALAIGAPMRGYRRGGLSGLSTIILIALIISVLHTAYSLGRAKLLWLIIGATGSSTLVNALDLLLFVIVAFSPIFTISLLTALYATYVGKPAPDE